MKKDKKLWLLLDLDQTILHTIPVRRVKSWEYFDYMHIQDDIFVFKTNNHHIHYVVKFRPGLKEFLLFAYEMYEIYIYTAGNREYANIIVQMIKKYILNDVDQSIKDNLFGSRIITRDETKSKLM